MTKPFTRGTWHGMTTYQCTLCQFDCMDEDQARAHYQDHFAEPAPELNGPPVPLIIDSAGTTVSVPTVGENIDEAFAFNMRTLK